MAEAATGDDLVKPAADEKRESEAAAGKKQRKGVISRIWRGFFGGRSEDYEKKLKYLSKEEASVHARMKRRALRSRKMARNIILFSATVEVAAVAFAIMTLRSLDLNWTMKIVRSLPVILSPGLSFIIYTTFVRFTRMLDRKDQKALERLRAERKAKIDELKERTNYYTTQQIIQRYDLDPAAKAAAATILASKLGADSGLKVHLGEESNKNNTPSARSEDAELVQSSGLRNRRQQSHSGSNSTRSGGTPQSITEMPGESGPDVPGQMVVEHHRGSSSSDGGWIARIAALLVGEDPSQSYALICGNCLRHNGLARREDFPHIMYYCPHCHALNTSGQASDHEPGSSSGILSSPTSTDGRLSNASSATGNEVTANTAAATQELPAGAAE